MTYLVFGTSGIHFFSSFGASIFLSCTDFA